MGVHALVGDVFRGRLCHKRTSFKQSAETIMVTEQPNPENLQGNRYYADVNRPAFQYWGWRHARDELIVGRYVTFHGSKWNYLFIDGHVSFFSSDQTLRPFTVTPWTG